MKLMMAAGFSRNFATACALRVLEWGSYEIAYTKLRDFDSIYSSLECIERTIQKVVEAWSGVITSLAKLAGGIRWDE